jgi:zinc ribbon protein
MFCPVCATQNPETSHFCRQCGANIGLVPQALTGQLAQPPAEEVAEDRRHRKDPTWERAFKNIFSGIAFLIVAIALSRTIGRGWWFWFLFPSFSMLATGLAQIVRLRRAEQRTARLTPRVTQTLAEHTNPEMLMQPPAAASVTERTTRHLNTHERE